MQQMELREALAEARTAADRSARLGGLQQQVNELMEQKTAELRRQLAGGSTDADTAARNLVREMQFLHKLADEIDELA
jgi:DnaJ-domain-containing protein 1